LSVACCQCFLYAFGLNDHCRQKNKKSGLDGG
jgi:hypothetical protein